VRLSFERTTRAKNTVFVEMPPYQPLAANLIQIWGREQER